MTTQDIAGLVERLLDRARWTREHTHSYATASIIAEAASALEHLAGEMADLENYKALYEAGTKAGGRSMRRY